MGLFDWLTGRKRKVEEQLAPSPPVPTSDDIVTALDSAETMAVDGRVPAPVLSRVRRITRTVRNTLPRIDNLGVASQDSYTVMATATDYLPEALSAYLMLPRDWADSRPVENGKSSLMLLIDQLDLLGATMDKMYDAVNRYDAGALIAHGRFLQEKFGHRPAPITVEPAPKSNNPLDLEGP